MLIQRLHVLNTTEQMSVILRMIGMVLTVQTEADTIGQLGFQSVVITSVNIEFPVDHYTGHLLPLMTLQTASFTVV